MNYPPNAGLDPTAWQPDTTGMRLCELHHGHCAYYAGDPARCDTCHATWAAITGSWGETRPEHETRHTNEGRRRRRHETS